MYIDLPTIDREALSKEICRLSVQPGGCDSPKTHGVYKPPCGEVLLHEMRGIVQRYIPVQVYPCNSFGRIAHHEAELREHTDRVKLDWTVTIMLKQDAPWGLEVMHNGKWKSFDVGKKGFLVPGRKIPHRRGLYKGKLACQLFLHYAENPEHQGDA